jgi:hypothetical protein
VRIEETRLPDTTAPTSEVFGLLVGALPEEARGVRYPESELRRAWAITGEREEFSLFRLRFARYLSAHLEAERGEDLVVCQRKGDVCVLTYAEQAEWHDVEFHSICRRAWRNHRKAEAVDTNGMDVDLRRSYESRKAKARFLIDAVDGARVKLGMLPIRKQHGPPESLTG